MRFIKLKLLSTCIIFTSYISSNTCAWPDNFNDCYNCPSEEDATLCFARAKCNHPIMASYCTEDCGSKIDSYSYEGCLSEVKPCTTEDCCYDNAYSKSDYYTCLLSVVQSNFVSKSQRESTVNSAINSCTGAGPRYFNIARCCQQVSQMNWDLGGNREESTIATYTCIEKASSFYPQLYNEVKFKSFKPNATLPKN